jgi:hypothetical protein
VRSRWWWVLFASAKGNYRFGQEVGAGVIGDRNCRGVCGTFAESAWESCVA